MYTFYGWIVDGIHSADGATECIHSMACGNGMHTFNSTPYFVDCTHSIFLFVECVLSMTSSIT